MNCHNHNVAEEAITVSTDPFTKYCKGRWSCEDGYDRNLFYTTFWTILFISLNFKALTGLGPFWKYWRLQKLVCQVSVKVDFITIV